MNNYHDNEWTVIYLDANSTRQVAMFDLFNQATSWATKVRKNGGNIIGVVTTAFYNNCIVLEESK